MKRSGYVILSAILSLILHLILLLFSDRIHMRNMTFAKDDEGRKVTVGLVNLQDLVWKRPDQKKINKEAEKQLKEAVKNSAKVKDIFTDAQLTATPKPKLRLAGLGRNILAPKLPEPEQVRPPTAPRPKIIEIDATDVPRERLALERPFTRKLMRRYIPTDTVPSMLAPGTLQGGVGNTFDIGMRLGGLPGMPGLKVGALPPGEEGAGPGAGVGGGASLSPMAGIPGLSGIDTVGGVEERAKINGERTEILDEFVNVTVTVYQERSGSGFFRADISPNPQSDVLRDVPKDILFVIDHSTSISSAKLARFKASVSEALEYLNPRDRFNVVSFTDRSQSLYELWQPVTEETIANGQKYVSGLLRGGMTDVFNSLAPYVKNSNGMPDRPLNIFLMSDGNSTVNIYEDDEFIRRMVNMNPGNVSIYPFSAGKKVNRDLFDFLAYHNRGQSLHVEKLEDFKETLVGYISTHASLIVADLKYHMSDDLSGDIFPKRLPHLYRDETLSLWGVFPEKTEELTLSLVGRDGTGQLRELLFRKQVDQCPRGTGDLAQEWAAQKLFHLLGQRTLTTNEQKKAAIQRQIRTLADKYDIYVPY